MKLYEITLAPFSPAKPIHEKLTYYGTRQAMLRFATNYAIENYGVGTRIIFGEKLGVLS